MTPATDPRELVLDRLIDAPPSAVWRCWTEPDLLRQWFAPKPWTTPKAELDLRPGGACTVTMADENGTEYPSPGIYLEVVAGRKLVFTDAYSAGWIPSEKPFFTAVLTFENEDGKTRYIARARHWTDEAKSEHEKMGFLDGWGLCADQLEALAKTL